ncbi:MAG: hypothetical protein IPJ65_02120 [Archangiaceae bacterium]|nr:hypothetical protein [Archangiaceae bacterium]
MPVLLLVSLLLCEAPVDAPRRTAPKLSWRLSVGSFLGSVWAAPSFRQNVEAFKTEQLSWLENHNSVLDSPYLIYAAPVFGPWMTLIRGGQQARDDLWLLVTSGVLQGVGITALAYRLFSQGSTGTANGSADEGLVLDLSPYVAGRLGISVSLSGF